MGIGRYYPKFVTHFIIHSSGSQLGVILSPRGYLSIPGLIFGCPQLVGLVMGNVLLVPNGGKLGTLLNIL